MRALYDSEARAMYIDVIDPPCEHSHGVDQSVDDLIFIHIDDTDRVVGVEILDADAVDVPALRAVALERGLDPQQVVASHAAALGAPDRTVTLAFGARIAA